MRKSVDVTKYEIDWQILRSSVKGKFNDNLSLKFDKVRSYFEQTYSYDRWERCVNWLEGLEKGMKDDCKKFLILEEINQYKSIKPIKRESIIINQQKNEIIKYDFQSRYILWKDLFLTNAKWLENGYFHKECNLFIDCLYSVFKNLNEIHLIDTKYNLKNLIQLRCKCSGIPNKHQFFF